MATNQPVVLPSELSEDEIGTPLNPGNYANIVLEKDAGLVRGDPFQLQADSSQGFRLRVGVDTPMLTETFTGSAINTNNWFQAVTTQTIAVSGGFLVLNSGSSVATSAVSRVQSYRTFLATGTFPLQLDFFAQYLATNAVVANNTTELGFGYAATTATPTDGAFFRWAADGSFKCVVNYNGTETTTDNLYNSNAQGNDLLAFPAANVTNHFQIVIVNDAVEFWINDILVGLIFVPATNGAALFSPNTQILFRNYNSTSVAPSQAVQVKISNVNVLEGDLLSGRDWPVIMAGQGGGAYTGQTGQTQGAAANYANSAAPSSASLSNTAAGYTTLGGQFQFAAVGGAETDYALFGFSVPAGSPTTSSKNLYISGCTISTVNTGAANATTATILQWSLGVGSTAVSLATTEGAGTKIRRVIPLGFQTATITQAINTRFDSDINVTFPTPLYAEAGSFVHVILKIPIGTATASQVIRGMVSINGYWE